MEKLETTGVSVALVVHSVVLANAKGKLMQRKSVKVGVTLSEGITVPDIHKTFSTKS